ncbi:MAG TPA: sigma-70 family RNA polymerase sigma factor [Isosphaeraceae bacterium]|jgi:RNA polymerase sigma-70 factor (ECF subfamily)
MAQNGPETDALLDLAGQGDDRARWRLLDRHRARLLRMVAVRMDGRLAARLDASDVVQEALADAARALPDYLSRRPMAFYPWLRQLAWDRLLLLHRHHIEARRRSVDREHSPFGPQLPDASAACLADRLIAGGTSPSGHLVREEVRARVREELTRLAVRDREVLVLRYLEMLSNREIAEVLGISEGAVKVRHLRALERLRGRLVDGDAGSLG